MPKPSLDTILDILEELDGSGIIFENPPLAAETLLAMGYVRSSCPHCQTSLVGEPIPPESRHLYGGDTHFDRTIGVEVRGVYDGILFWTCPDCAGTWHRWPKGHPARNIARRYMKAES